MNINITISNTLVPSPYGARGQFVETRASTLVDGVLHQCAEANQLEDFKGDRARYTMEHVAFAVLVSAIAKSPIPEVKSL